MDESPFDKRLYLSAIKAVNCILWFEVKAESPHSRSHRPLCYLFTVSTSGLLFIQSRLSLAS